MVEVVLQVLGPPRDDDAFVDIPLLELPGVLEKEPQSIIRKPAAVADPLAAEKVPAGNIIALNDAIPSQSGGDLLSKRRGHPFIGVEAQDPWPSSSFQSDVLLGGKSMPRLLKDLRAEIPGDVRRPVLAEVVDDDDFISPGDAFEAVADVRRFIPGDDRDRKAFHGIFVYALSS